MRCRELYWALECDMYGVSTGGVTGSRRFSRCLPCAIGKPGRAPRPGMLSRLLCACCIRLRPRRDSSVSIAAVDANFERYHIRS